MVPGGVVNAYRVEHDRVDAGELLKEHETDGDAHRLQVSLAKDVGQLELSFACKLTRQLDGLNKIENNRIFTSCMFFHVQKYRIWEENRRKSSRMYKC